MTRSRTTSGTWGRVACAVALAATVTAGSAGTAVGAAPAARPAPEPAAATQGQTGASPDRRAQGEGDGTYLVQLADQPAAAYRGGIPGYPATRPQPGRKLDPNSTAVRRYAERLVARHDAALASVRGGAKAYSYTVAFNGFAAELTKAQADRLAGTPDVLAVTRDEAREVDTATTPRFLGLTGADGFYAKVRATGEDVVIGIVDSGVWPEHPSFSDRDSTGKRVYRALPGWNGRCLPGEGFTAASCNQKLIGARYYNAGFGGNAGIDAALPFEFNSPRDHNGHGSHTASTAGGNAGVSATGPGAGLGSINGIAPRARIASYKACWSVPETAGSCYNSDTIAAIDQAVSDGVDVLNYSISGTRTNFRDPVEIAFLFAADAGVFVAASAGNSGPTTSTVAHPGPWLTTVAAGTHDRDGAGSVTLGNGETYQGASLASPVGPLPFVDAGSAGLPDADPTAVARCYGAGDNGGKAALDPAEVTGKIVLCDRGQTALLNKSQAVTDAGGLGMVLVNAPTTADTLLAFLHPVPTVHLPLAAREAVKAYAATAGATATINASTVTSGAAAPFTAGFSSRGPLQAGAGNLLKPDLIAPGQDILAAVAPPNNGGRLFDLYSGTSMSSPHVAGLAALLKQARPTWSPMAIKSALMTTGRDVLDGPATNPLVIFRQGAGHVVPLKAADPGLVFDSGFADWLRFLCGAQPGGGCAGVAPLDPSDYNSPSIAVGALVGTRTVTRTVTSVSAKTETYRASVAGLAGFTSAVSPETLTLAPGQSASFTLTSTRTTATLNSYSGGQLTLAGDGGHTVRVPIVLRPVALAAPAEVSGSGEDLGYDVGFGYTGAFTATARGLVPATERTGAVATDESVDFEVTLPAGTTHARFSLFDADVAEAADLDLEVYEGPTLVGSSGTATSTEQVDLSYPAGTSTQRALRVRVVGYAVPVGQTAFTLSDWVLGSTAAGNTDVTAPAAAVQGPGRIELAFSGLAADTRYLGSVAYAGVADLPAPTVVRVDTP